ncbi:exonuclease-endonuclease-phosphatase family protein [Metarhizium robertsii]|uniref:Exonuclease-endonuclease-phosphatase family protein n=1 Tax=Metarhizium robertsii TaxID=568076 RepID=A0A014PHW6_9HYPO|nr:exonuclease-endonuclease-phosphatase family protein [Metarhizium robertsii]
MTKGWLDQVMRTWLLDSVGELPEAGQGDIDDAVITYSPVDSWDSNDTRPRVMTYIREDSRILADQKRPALIRDILWLTVNGATIVNCYRQPHYESPWTSLLRRSAPEMTLVAGDFNAKHYSWQTGRLEGCGEDIATWAAENGLNLLNTADPEPATGAGQIGCQSCRSPRTERNEKCAVVADECPEAAAEYRAIRRILPLGFSQEAQLARRELQRVVRHAKRQYWRILIDGFSDSASVYKAVRWLKSPGAFQPPPLQIVTMCTKHSWTKRMCWDTALLNAARKLRCQKQKTPRSGQATRLPAITVKLLQAAWDITGGHVRRLYQGCLTVGRHPGVFREAEVAMIPKPGKRNLSPPRVWRPISLLYCPGEGLERMIARQLACASIYYAVLHPQQASALPKRSAVDLVAVLTPIELWDDSVLKIQFWRIPRTLNAIADDAAKQAARKVDGPDEYCEIKGVLT